MSLKKTPFFELRSGTVDLLHFVVKTIDLGQLRAELGRRFESTPAFFAGESVAIDVRRLTSMGALRLEWIEALLVEFKMRAAGVVINPEQREWAEAQGAPILESREKRAASAEEAKDTPEAPDIRAEGSESEAVLGAAANPHAADAADTASAPQPNDAPSIYTPTLIIDRPLRSGQRIYAEGDVVVLGLVSYGAEIIAEGNIHIYAPLRGRALAGVHGNLGARIFCTCLEPELISIAGIYRTTEHPLAADFLGKSVQIRLDDEKLIFEPLRLT
jgi:septum site-determining protein MinC